MDTNNHQMDDGWSKLRDSLSEDQKTKPNPVKCGFFPVKTDEEVNDAVEDAIQGHQTALTILDQIGTLTRAKTCARDFVSLPYGYERDGVFYRGGVQFRLASGVSAEVLLNGLDLYEVNASKGDKTASVDGVYFDVLPIVLLSVFDEVRA